MPLLSFSYNHVNDGAAIDSYIKATLKGIDPNKYSRMGNDVWKYALTLIYTDFVGQLQTSILSFALQASVQFIAGPPMPWILSPPVLAAFSGLTMPTATLIDGYIKAECKSLTQKTITRGGSIAWKWLFKCIFDDMINVIPDAVANMANAAIVTVPPLALSPPHTGTIAPVPGTLQVPYISATLKGYMQSVFNEANARSLATMVDGQIKGALSTGDPNKDSTMGTQVWNFFLLALKNHIDTNLKINIQMFLSGTQNFAVTIGDPGNVPYPPGVLPTTIGLLGRVF